MAIPDLPVFSFRVNWENPLDENVAFLTDVLRSVEACEQRRKLRLTPRRSYDVDLLLVGRERTYWDLFMNRIGASEVLCPLYWDVVKLTAATEASTTTRIEFDTTFRDWAYQEGGAALLMRDNATEYELVEIMSVDASGVDLAIPTVASWPVGTTLLPLRRGRVEAAGELSAVTAAVATVTTRIVLKDENHWTPAADTFPLYSGLRVMTWEPNWVDPLSVDFPREIVSLDNDTGQTYETFPLNRVMLGQQHRWFLPGKAKLAAFRDLIYRHAGRVGSFWLPTFKADFTLKANVASNSKVLRVENTGYGLLGGPTNGREYIAIKHSTGYIFRKIVSVAAGPTPDTELLTLDANVGLALQPGLVRRISFMDTARFDTDEFTISHYAGIEGHHESSASFRTFRNTRSAPAILVPATAVGVKTSAQCGVAEEVPCPLYFPEFQGWDYEISCRRSFTQKLGVQGFYVHRPVEFGGATGGGNAYGGKFGSDFDDKFKTVGLVSWMARRVKVDSGFGIGDVWSQSMIGTWHATIDMGIVNFFNAKPPLNEVTIEVFARHWSEPFPGRLVFSTTTTSNIIWNVPVPMDIDWREWR